LDAYNIFWHSFVYRLLFIGWFCFEFIEEVKMTYEELCKALESNDEQERNEAELYLMGKFLYEGD